jgi:toxin YoeB
MKLTFHDLGWEDYLWWQEHDRQTLRKVNKLIEAVRRDPTVGIGKPERLHEDLSGWWSRRITEEHRLVYRVIDETVEIASCRFHYFR